MDDGHFEKELEELNKMIMNMGKLVEEAFYQSSIVLIKRDISLAKMIIGKDREIDLMELSINKKCLQLLALYQPVASDLRFITSTMLVVTDLERIGDLSQDIAQRIIELKDKPAVTSLSDLPVLVEIVKTMMHESLEAFIKRDTLLAKKVPQMESNVRALRDAICKKLQEQMVKNPTNVSWGLSLIHITRYLKRIGDHATNIVENVIYMVDAQVIKHQKRV